MAELVFIHGAGDSAAVWQKQVERFSGRHEVLAVDLPGHGTRLGDAPLEDHERNAEEVVRQVRARGFRRPVLVGHSMGGAIALTLTRREPELPEKLVLVASGARLRMHPDFIAAAREQADAAPDAPQVAKASIPLERTVAPGASEETRGWLAERVGQSTAQATYADFLATDRFDAMERLAEVRLPTLVIAGEDDQMTPPKYQRFLAERLPRAKLVLLPDAGHYVQVEQELGFNEALEKFLSEHAT